MGRKRRNDENGFEKWGGYMEAKKSKLMEQYDKNADKNVEKLSDIFNGIAIFVNGYTRPNAEELKQLMAEHGGVYHTYQASSTTHIIASNLPNIKILKLGSVPIVKPGWIEDSIVLGRLLDFSKYLLYTNQSRTQPRLNFQKINQCAIGEDGQGETLPLNKIKNGPLQDVNQCSIKNSADVSSNKEEINTNDECDSLGFSPEIFEDTPPSSTTIETVINKTNSKNNEIASKSINTINNNAKHTKTASDPKFLSEFYNNSRLHLIATLGAEFKQLVNDMREQPNHQFVGLQQLTLNLQEKRTIINPIIMHIDMDCFFVSVGLRNRPELRGKPVAVTHSKGGTSNRENVDRQAEFAFYMERLPEGATSRLQDIDNNSSLSEIASCSYEARKCGIKNGMFMGSALKLCPQLKAIPYDFEGYREVSSTLYRTLAEYTLDIEAVSCDEMYVDCSKILSTSGLTVAEWATHIRGVIAQRTGCPCSTGFGSNRLQARMATKRAKPNGQYHLKPEDVEEYMSSTPLSELPGVGRAILHKLKDLGLENCGDVQGVTLAVLQQKLGNKIATTIYEQAKGVDSKPLQYEHERKSVSAEINYGIRFKNEQEAFTFLRNLSVEVQERLSGTGMRAKCITLKLMIRAKDAPVETAKFLGHGVCDSLSRSTTLGTSMADVEIIYREIKLLYEKLNVPYADLRGLGIQLSRLEKGKEMNKFLKNFLNQPNNDESIKENGKDLQKQISKSSTSVPKTSPVKSNMRKVRGKKNAQAKSKAGNNSKTITNAVNQVSNYFKTTHKARTPLWKECVKSDNIDRDVLNQLPLEIRNEVIKEYQINIEPAVNKVPNNDLPPTTSCKLNSNTDSVGGKKQVSKKQKKGFSTLSYESFKKMLKSWLNSQLKPLDVDVDMLAGHFKRLSMERNIEKLHSILKFLHRNIEEKEDCCWHDAYFTILNNVQEGMILIYGNALLAPRKFNCALHS